MAWLRWVASWGWRGGEFSEIVERSCLFEPPPPPLVGDITFEEYPGGFEIWYSNRISEEHQDWVDASADWLELQPGVGDIGQIEHRILIVDRQLDDELKNGLIAFWAERVEDLELK